MFSFEYGLDFFIFWGFLLHFFILYYNSFRVLNFLMKSEFVFLFLFLVLSVSFFSYENTFLLVFLTVLACEVSVGLSLLVGFVRCMDKKNVKSNFFVGF